MAKIGLFVFICLKNKKTAFARGPQVQYRCYKPYPIFHWHCPQVASIAEEILLSM